MKLVFLTLFLAVGTLLRAQDMNLYAKQLFIHNGDTMRYRILLPENYDRSNKYPLLIILHGAGERGNDNEKQLAHGATLFLKDDVRKKYPAIIVFPQCPEFSFWSNVEIISESRKREFQFKDAESEPTFAMKMLEELLQKLLKDYPVQRKKVYVGGVSMGGMGTFELVARHPKTFAAAFPICGGGSPATAPNLIKTNWWIFHGAKDELVPPENSAVMVNALKANKANVKFTLYPEANHNSCDLAFEEPELLSWLFSQEK